MASMPMVAFPRMCTRAFVGVDCMVHLRRGIVKGKYRLPFGGFWTCSMSAVRNCLSTRNGREC
jgi:hypothetical protein